ncbi:MAG: hypothetical protein ACE5IF_01310 [Candidatus Bathyarchaeia archaeon]
MNTKVDKPLFGFMTRNYLVLTLTSSLWGFAASITNTYFSFLRFGAGRNRNNNRRAYRTISIASNIIKLEYVNTLLFGVVKRCMVGTVSC